jgi:hypothetical protein
MTSLTLTHDRRHSSYLLVEDGGRALGSLVVDKRLRHGEVVGDSGRIPVRSHGLRRRSVTAGDERAPLIQLDVPRATLPGGLATRWEVSRNRREYFGTLTTGEGVMRLAFPTGEPGQIETTGNWPQAYLAILTASFALLARRRGDTILNSALVSVASGGAH